MKKIIALILLVIISTSVSATTFVMNAGYTQAYLEILRLRFGTANALINAENKKDPSNAAYLYLHSYIDFLKVVITEEDKDYIKLVANKSSRIKLLEKISHESPWRLYSLAQLNLQSGIASVKAGEYFKAAVDINKAYSQFKENDKKFPGFKPNKAGLGILHVLIGSIPDSYTWVTGVMGMEGNVNKGFKELKEILTTSQTGDPYPFLFNECLFLSTFVTYNLAVSVENTEVMIQLLQNEKISREVKNNPMLIYAASSFYSHQGHNDKAIELLTNRPLDKSYFPFHYLDYLTGVALLNKLDPKARIYFLKYVTTFKGKNFIKSAYQRLAWSFLSEGDTSSYSTYISRIGVLGATEMENDKEAAKEFKKKSAPNPELLKIRLLFDGGYYSRAYELLSSIKSELLQPVEKVEYLYRNARINHKLGSLEQAKKLYNETYMKGKYFRNYYAANSILILGNIYEDEGNKKQALWCYRECLKLAFDEYRTSIEQKAKAGINRLTNPVGK
jgi:tetratricopeptide (TPR) repeat protein